ncbi:hypothetical protein E3O25_02570 [Cryobacterium sp. TMT1-3]|uniref:DNA mismatch repair protein n=1 Tax=Cryobacterium luteum TaxID=1424661 RepID=A0A1H8IIV4_9MICO|nr:MULTISPECIES: hypothetical protein [Cryobacterium]TFB95500.1 hypothetical protein E3O10_00145 [Cryobacterium luteum]TFC31351.1 hypothetical protein E3O25_02570 [Cryobacterium sp. TMT1-3]SEN68136.1 hypothetical protein SAMN05216281_111101 [Cryobacterium luteum]
MSTLSAPRTARAGVPVVRGRSFILVRDGLWRIVDPDGAVIGYIECHPGGDGDRYSARRVVFATRTREVGVFWRFDDAVDCFR